MLSTSKGSRHRKVAVSGKQREFDGMFPCCMTPPSPYLIPKRMLSLEPPSSGDGPSVAFVPPSRSATAPPPEEATTPRVNLLVAMGMVRLENGKDATAASVMRAAVGLSLRSNPPALPDSDDSERRKHFGRGFCGKILEIPANKIVK